MTVVVPDRDQSATSHSLTLHRPLRIHRHGADRFSVDGTPTDCVLIAYHGLLEERPDLVVSGINHGPNMGEDVFYSGTVAAAIEGAMQGSPAIAASLVTREPADFRRSGALHPRAGGRSPAPGTAGTSQSSNVNLPHRPWREIRGVRITRLGTRVYQRHVDSQDRPARPRLLLDRRREPVWKTEAGTDVERRAPTASSR